MLTAWPAWPRPVKFELRREILVDFQPSPTTGEHMIMCTKYDTFDPDWMTPIIEYLRDGLLPEDGDEGWKVKRKAARF